MKRDRAFTIVEMLVVIGIILVLASLILTSLWVAQGKGREAKCVNNMAQLGKALMMYRDDNSFRGKELNPLRLTLLCQAYRDTFQKELFLCPWDSSRGEEGGKPPSAANQFPELDEPNANPAGPLGVQGIYPCSYMYEFCMAATCSWGWQSFLNDLGPNPDASVDLDGNSSWSSWGEVKKWQMDHGDNASGASFYPETKFPILRCFWHTDKPDSDQDRTAILNLSYTGNVFKSGARWETTALNIP